ncbi:acetyltransferase [Corynebacterium pseudodiphtheriticum]|uniref:acyltransferase family protein n=1 Tax=Corynebacterium pseudodiphtheriticum TaxID=37637 RepID=UPI00223ABFEE|nr:acyltransferase family protein [Corynebacterium pseudodiphtheriticum]MCT1635456.1 acetyltransferase [Corynebacterium pseudodiphtheriticum]MCT1666428.1 acetyltransferase [Corynebacterium pseudodiphtheriticum]
MSKTRARLRQVAGLDGLRGLAVAAVVVYHFFGDVLPGGYLGVDMFFVLSGFLITSLLLREYDTTGTVNLKDFWIRRLRRIMPTAVVVLVVCTAIVGVIGGDFAVNIRTQFLGSLFFVSNWTQIATSASYFADNEVEVFAHYWSLAVEEQFYVLWPLALFALLAVWGARKRLHIALASLLAAVASAIAMAVVYSPDTDPTRVYYGTDTHAFGLLIGAVLAMLLTTSKADPTRDSWPVLELARARFLAALIGVSATAIYVVQLFFMADDGNFPYWGGLFITSLAGTGMIYAVVYEVAPLRWIFEFPLMRYLGQRSFSIYLWHWPVIMIIRELAPEETLDGHAVWWGLLAVAVSLGLSELSYRWIENPFRRKGYGTVFAVIWEHRPRKASASTTTSPKAPVAWIAGLVLTVGSVSGTAYAVVNSSDKTQLEQDLDALAEHNRQQRQEMQEQAGGAETGDAKKTDTEKSDGEKSSNDSSSTGSSSDREKTKDKPNKEDVSDRSMPAGDEITAIGDSVMLASLMALNKEYPGIYVDADVSRAWGVGVQVASSLASQGLLRDTVVLGFGTNSEAHPGEIASMMEIMGDDRTVVMVLPYGDRSWMPRAREQIIEAAKTYDNVYIADWCTHAMHTPGALREDGIHPDPIGATEYVTAITYALQQYVNGDKNTDTLC